MRKIKKGDTVIVIAGKDKGKTGVVLAVNDSCEKLKVEGLNLVKKHVRPNPNAGVQGGIMTKEALIHRSNVMIYNPNTKKGDRVKIKTLEDGRKVRCFVSDDEVIDV